MNSRLFWLQLCTRVKSGTYPNIISVSSAVHWQVVQTQVREYGSYCRCICFKIVYQSETNKLQFFTNLLTITNGLFPKCIIQFYYKFSLLLYQTPSNRRWTITMIIKKICLLFIYYNEFNE